MPSPPRPTDQRPPLPQITLRGALAAYSVIGVILSIPLIGLGFTLTAVILLTICVLQLPLFLLFGAFGRSDDLPATADLPEWDRWRNERDSAK